ncbi:hypothetical protein IAI18_13380 [Acetobacteraceae bacterium H6797]|nr:hypothetical protein [Acetobacteraceae bacterium H6797]
MAIAVDGEAFSATVSALRDPRLGYIALILAGRFCPNGIGAFDPDWARMSEAVRGEFPASLSSPKALRRHRAALLHFFTELPDGRWAPNLNIFATPGQVAGYHA